MARSNDSINDDLFLCGRMARSLAHIVRGDLAVIQNDLTYLGTIVPPDEIERSKNRCARASATLQKLSILADNHSTSVCGSEELLELFRVDSSARGLSGRMVTLERGSIRGWIEIVEQLIGPWRASASLHGERPALLVIQLTSGALRTESVDYSSWHAFAAAERGERGVLEGCVADLVMRSYGWSVHLRNDSSRMVTTLCVPISEGGGRCER